MHAQVDQLADMISSEFMVHSQLDVLDHFNTSHAITAAELAVDLFWNQVSPMHLTAPATSCRMMHGSPYICKAMGRVHMDVHCMKVLSCLSPYQSMGTDTEC